MKAEEENVRYIYVVDVFVVFVVVVTSNTYLPYHHHILLFSAAMNIIYSFVIYIESIEKSN